MPPETISRLLQTTRVMSLFAACGLGSCIVIVLSLPWVYTSRAGGILVSMLLFAPGILLAGRLAIKLGWLTLVVSKARAIVALGILCQVFPFAFLTIFWGWKASHGAEANALSVLAICAGLLSAALLFSAAAAVFQGRWDGRIFHAFAIAAALTLIFSLAYEAASPRWDAWSMAVSLVPTGSALFNAAAGYSLKRVSEKRARDAIKSESSTNHE